MSKEHMEQVLKRIIYVALALGVVFLVYIVRTYVLDQGTFFTIQAYDIKGAESLSHREVISLSGLKTGETLIDKELRNVEKNIARSPYVKSVSVRLQYPSTVQIFLTEYTPIAFIQTNQLKLVDRYGRVLPIPVEKDLNDLPVIIAKNTIEINDGSVISDTLLYGALDLLYTAQNVSVDLSQIISEINLLGKMPQLRLVQGGAELKIARENVVSQLLTFDFFLKKKISTDFLQRVSYVDLRFKNRVVVKKRG